MVILLVILRCCGQSCIEIKGNDVTIATDPVVSSTEVLVLKFPGGN